MQRETRSLSASLKGDYARIDRKSKKDRTTQVAGKPMDAARSRKHAIPKLMQIDDKYCPQKFVWMGTLPITRNVPKYQWLTRSDAISRSLTVLDDEKQAENRAELQSGGLQPMPSRLVAVKRRQEGCEDCEGACFQTSRLRCRYASRILGALHRGMRRGPTSARSGDEEGLEISNSRRRMRLTAPVSHQSGHKDDCRSTAMLHEPSGLAGSAARRHKPSNPSCCRATSVVTRGIWTSAEVLVT